MNVPVYKTVEANINKEMSQPITPIQHRIRTFYETLDTIKKLNPGVEFVEVPFVEVKDGN